MGIFTINEEVPSKVSASRMFKGLITDNHNLVPKIAPQLIKSAEIIQGDGGTGSIKQLNFGEGSPFPYVKLSIDECDEDQLICKYTFIEGGELNEAIKGIYSETQCVPIPGGGCIVKMKRVFTIADGAELSPEELGAHKVRAQKLFIVIHGYLMTHPQVYAERG